MTRQVELPEAATSETEKEDLEKQRSSHRSQSETDHEGLIHPGHGAWFHGTEALHKTQLVDRADLVQEHDGMSGETSFSLGDHNFSRIEGWFHV